MACSPPFSTSSLDLHNQLVTAHSPKIWQTPSIYIHLLFFHSHREPAIGFSLTCSLFLSHPQALVLAQYLVAIRYHDSCEQHTICQPGVHKLILINSISTCCSIATSKWYTPRGRCTQIQALPSFAKGSLRQNSIQYAGAGCRFKLCHSALGQKSGHHVGVGCRFTFSRVHYVEI